ncbi:MAG: transglutaminase N-terminal domain-containing protein [Steroidobacteraceae bacterium]
MRRLKILHRTYYNFRGTVQLEPHRLLLRPREGAGLHIEFSKLEITPSAQIRWHRDVYDNSVAVATFASSTAQLAIVSECIVQQFDEMPLDFLMADFAVNYPFTYDARVPGSSSSLYAEPAAERPGSARCVGVPLLASWRAGANL